MAGHAKFPTTLGLRGGCQHPSSSQTSVGSNQWCLRVTCRNCHKVLFLMHHHDVAVDQVPMEARRLLALNGATSSSSVAATETPLMTNDTVMMLLDDLQARDDQVMTLQGQVMAERWASLVHGVISRQAQGHAAAMRQCVVA